MGAELLTRHTNDFATITRVAALVANNIDRADQMIRDLLDANRIQAGDQATLFDQYRRTRSARTGGQKGWGLGLTLCMGIANAHGGSIDVESSAEFGTTFRVNLPVDARQSTQ